MQIQFDPKQEHTHSLRSTSLHCKPSAWRLVDNCNNNDNNTNMYPMLLWRVIGIKGLNAERRIVWFVTYENWNIKSKCKCPHPRAELWTDEQLADERPMVDLPYELKPLLRRAQPASGKGKHGKGKNKGQGQGKQSESKSSESQAQSSARASPWDILAWNASQLTTSFTNDTFVSLVLDCVPGLVIHRTVFCATLLLSYYIIVEQSVFRLHMMTQTRRQLERTTGAFHWCL